MMKMQVFKLQKCIIIILLFVVLSENLGHAFLEGSCDNVFPVLNDFIFDYFHRMIEILCELVSSVSKLICN